MDVENEGVGGVPKGVVGILLLGGLVLLAMEPDFDIRIDAA